MTKQPVFSQNFYNINENRHHIKTIGILGGGQLGQMLAQSVQALGMRCAFLDDAPNPPARLLGKVYTSEQFFEFASACDAYSFEFENTPTDFANHLQKHRHLAPNATTLHITQDRLNEKKLFQSLDILAARFFEIQSLDDLEAASDKLGLPLVLKTTKGGYDGKGQALIKTKAQLQVAWQTLGVHAPLIAEEFIEFEKEVSAIAVRAKNGDMRYYQLTQNIHEGGILIQSIHPAPNSQHLQQTAERYLQKIMTHLDYVGVLTLEMFVKNDMLIANEIAPRVHNSGHWSIEAAVCSQFENHMRAVADLPLGDTSTIGPSVMLNVIGQYPPLDKLLAMDGVHVHLYDKTPRPGRKLAHITIMPVDGSALLGTVDKVKALLCNEFAV